MNKAIILDRDSTLVHDPGYVHKIEDFRMLPGVVEGMKLLSKTDYKLIIVSNQAGIGKEVHTEKDTQKFNEHLKRFIIEKGGRIDGIYFCPHKPEDNCNCRKPETEMLVKAKKEFNLNLEKSFVIGDKTTDIEMGKRKGCKTILVKTGHKGEYSKIDTKPDFIAGNFLEAVKIVLENED